ncbi:hypothetical protein [Cupriavidus sp. UGS-1]|uniref:hypothetical protein n=1 Tax=Cupriavidus sp. UGS-1 TaxID=2899826 RepID=UPI001E49E00F|nr:hypothetical protein [Cupriavidus sp. UGS-1]MCD9122719.1 hypothetical protein [Cupriavidus sp. UGS-1]
MTYRDTNARASYLKTPVGQQLLRHYAARDAVRHATPLIPLRIADVLRFVQCLFDRAGCGHRPA